MAIGAWKWIDTRMPTLGAEWRKHASEYYAPKNFNFWYFFGYLLPWGQMSYWGAQVIVNLFGTIPFIGPDLALWIRGDYVVSDATLNRFFALHVIALPLVLLGLVVAHVLALHDVGSNNPDGVDAKQLKGPDGHYLDAIAFHPYYTVKDLVGAVVFLAIFCFVMFFFPEMCGYFLE